MAAFKSISMETLNNTLYPVFQTAETRLSDKIDSLGENPTTADMILLQQELGRWTMLVQMHSTILKDFKDSMQGVLSNMK